MSRYVALNLQNVFHPKFGMRNIKSWIPRVNPPIEPVEFSQEAIDRNVEMLMEWGRKYFKEPNDDYFRETALASVIYIGYGNGLGRLDTIESDLALQFTFFLWLLDDMVENAIVQGLDRKVFVTWTNFIAKISQGPMDLDGSLSPPPPVEGSIPAEKMFHNYALCLYDWHQSCYKHLPQLEKKIPRFNRCMEEYVHAMQWFATDAVNSRYSEDSFKAFRIPISYFQGIAELLAMVNGVILDDEFQANVVFQRMVAALNAIGAYSNDLLGVKKDFQPEAHDNLVVIKVMQKNVGLDAAVNEVSQLISNEFGDYITLKSLLLENYGGKENKGFVDYLAVWECLLHGHWRIYTDSSSPMSLSLEMSLFTLIVKNGLT